MFARVLKTAVHWQCAELRVFYRNRRADICFLKIFFTKTFTQQLARDLG